MISRIPGNVSGIWELTSIPLTLVKRNACCLQPLPFPALDFGPPSLEGRAASTPSPWGSGVLKHFFSW
jgi:hypothetical protein